MGRRLANLPWTIFKLLAGLSLIVGLLYLGACGIANFWPKASVDPPDKGKAEYQVYISNTHSTFYSDDVLDQDGIVTIDGYYERIDGEYKYRKTKLMLDRQYFGNITVSMNQ